MLSLLKSLVSSSEAKTLARLGRIIFILFFDVLEMFNLVSTIADFYVYEIRVLRSEIGKFGFWYDYNGYDSSLRRYAMYVKYLDANT